MNKLNTVLLASILTVSTSSVFAGSKMNNPAFESLSFNDKKDLAQVLMEFKSLPDEVRLALCNGELVDYLNSQEYSGDFELAEEVFSEVDDLSQDAHFALTQVATKILADNNGECTLNGKQYNRVERENNKKGGFWSIWNRLWGGGEKRSKN